MTAHRASPNDLSEALADAALRGDLDAASSSWPPRRHRAPLSNRQRLFFQASPPPMPATETTPPSVLSQALVEAAKQGQLGQVEQLIKHGAKPLFQNSRALVEAAWHGHAECVAFLIPLSDCIDDFSRALSYAARGGSVDCVKLLIPVSDPTSQNSAALVQAAYHGHPDCARLLMPVSHLGVDNFAPLRHAVAAGHAECAALLLAASPPPPGKLSASFAHIALGMGHPHIAAMIEAFYEARALSIDTPKATSNARPRGL